MLEGKVDNIRKGGEDDAHEQLKSIKSEASTLVTKSSLNGALSEEWGAIMNRANQHGGEGARQGGEAASLA